MNNQRFLLAALLLAPVIGCGVNSETRVLDQNAPADPSLNEASTDPAKYQELLKGPENP